MTAEQRTEKPTPQRRREARKRGQVAQSADLVAALCVLAALLTLRYLGASTVEDLRGGFGRFLGWSPTHSESLNMGESVRLARGVLTAASVIALPLLLVVFGTVTVSGMFQSGFLVRPAAVVPRLARLSPAAGMARLFSSRGLGRGIFALLKCAVLAGVLVWGIAPLLQRLGPLSPAELMTTPLPVAAERGVDHVLEVGIYAALALVALGVLDWLFQRWQLERDLRMTRREVEEEIERQEGDGRIKGRRRVLWRRVLEGATRRERNGGGTP